MQQPRLTRRALLATGAGVALARPAGAGSSVLRVRSYADMQVIDPGFTRASPEGDIARCLFRQLIQYKSGTSWEWELDAAEKIEQADPLTIAFALKPGIAWSGGFGTMTADDVRYSFERIADPAVKSPFHGDWATLDHVEVTGPLTGVIHLRQPFAPLWLSTLPWNAGMILCRKAMEQAGGRFTTEPPATCGPYMLKSWQPKQRTVFARNPDYVGAAADFDEIDVLPIEDAKTAELAFAAGELDITATSVGSLPNLRKATPAGAKLVVRPSIAFTWIGMNVAVPPFDDVRVRRAVQRAIDVDTILDAVYFGGATRATGIVAPGLLGHRDTKPLARDMDAAKRLLAEAGKSGGFACALDILNVTDRLTAAQIVQANLGELGIEVQINVHDSGTYWTLGDQSKGDAWKRLNLLLQRYTTAPDPSWATTWFVPSQIGVWNWERWDSPEFGALHAKALVEFDRAARAAMYVRMQDLMEESGAYLFLTHEVSSVLHRDSVSPGLMPDARFILPAMRHA